MTDNGAADDTRSEGDGSDGAEPTTAALVLRAAGPVERRTAGEPERARRSVRELTDWAWRNEAVVIVRSAAGYRLRHALRDAVRLGWFVIRGHGRWVRKAWTFFTYADLRADARAARVAGDPERRRAAQELIRADARARWARAGIAVERAGGSALGAGLVGLLLWLVAQVLPREGMWPWLAGLYDVLAWIGHAAALVVPAVLWLTVTGVVVAAAFEGRDRTPGAGWLIHPDRTDADSWVDERMISQALAHLGIAPMDRFFKDGAQLAYTVPARVDGNGTYAQVRLPMGVTAGMVADRRDRLAANLGRAKLETWPTEGGEAGLLDLWVADRGVLGRGAGRWPLLDDGQVDVFDGVPFGRSQRGQLVAAPILERNYVIGGQPGQGKTSAGRTLCLGCVLDPSVELRVFVFAANPDFDPMAPRLARYVKGDDDDAIEAGLTELRWLREEVTRRGRLLERAGAAKVTRLLADRAAGLHPMVVVFDECHELFEHRDYGAEAGGLAVRVVKKARKCGITCLFLTQSPTARSIPRDLTRNCTGGVAFAVADQVANDGLLGSGAYRQGIRATELRPGDDRGTAVTVGLTANRFELVNTFYVPFDEEDDQVTPVVSRAMALLAERGRSMLSSSDPAAEAAPADHLADIRAVLQGEPRVRTQVVLARLAQHNPAEYEGWTFQRLTEVLAEAGLSARKSGGVMVVRAPDVALALADRAEEVTGVTDGGVDDEG